MMEVSPSPGNFTHTHESHMFFHTRISPWVPGPLRFPCLNQQEIREQTQSVDNLSLYVDGGFPLFSIYVWIRIPPIKTKNVDATVHKVHILAPDSNPRLKNEPVQP